VSEDCQCAKPNRPTGREPEQLPPWECLTCGGYACEYASMGRTRCSPAICDCFIAQFPDSPRDLHPEAFVVSSPTADAQVAAMREVADTAARALLDP
jgi:hypothetical protein